MPTKHEIIKANYGHAMYKMKWRIRFIARDLGWATARNITEAKKEWHELAEKRASEWFMESSHSPVKKQLEEMTHKELQQALTVMERLLQYHYKKVSQ